MFDKFTKGSINAIVHAQQEARRMKHPSVGCDHMLVGLFVDSNGIAFELLRSSGVNLEQLRSAAAKLHKKGTKASPKELPFDADALTALECAFRESMSSKQRLIETEHLLLGLLFTQSDNENLAMQIIDELGVKRHEFRRQVMYGIMHFSGPGPDPDDASIMSQGAAKELLGKCPQVFMFAVAESMRLKQSQLSSEMIFLGLLGAGGTVIRVLEDFGVTLEVASEKIEKLVNQGSGIVSIELPVTQCAKRLLQFSSDEAVQLGHDTLNARHLLLGFTHAQDGVAWQILKEKNVGLDDLRNAALSLFEDRE